MKNSVPKDNYPFTLADIRRSIPAELFRKDELKFLVSLAYSQSFTLVLMYLAMLFVPLTLTMLPVWILYAIVTGTVWTGVWVLGHECGHGSFSNNGYLNDSLGYILHSTLLVPYFSWQHSHSVHHSKSNHLTLGETHVPIKKHSKDGQFRLSLIEIIGLDSFAFIQIFTLCTIGWPLYLMFGVSGGPARGFTSHYIVPNKLFTSKHTLKVMMSNIGVAIMIYFLYLWAQQTSFNQVLAIYIGPYLVVNSWLTGITYLQHTEKEVPYYDETQWTWLKGALCTIDRNYPPFIDALHHQIGTTHVLHHIFSDIPHYNAQLATIEIKKVLGANYLNDQNNIFSAYWKSSKLTVVDNKGDGVWKFD